MFLYHGSLGLQKRIQDGSKKLGNAVLFLRVGVTRIMTATVSFFKEEHLDSDLKRGQVVSLPYLDRSWLHMPFKVKAFNFVWKIPIKYCI